MGGWGSTYNKKKQWILATSVFVLANSGFAQDSGGGLTSTLTVSQRLNFSDNPNFEANGESGVQSITNLSYTLGSVTRTQRFNLRAGASYETGAGETELNPFVSFGYGLQSGNAEFSLNTNFRQSDVADAVFFFLNQDFEFELLELDGGTRRDFDAEARIELGKKSRFGTTLTLGYDRRSFQDTVNANLLDETVWSSRLAFRFDINSQLSLSTFYEYTDEDEDSPGTDRISNVYGVAADMEFSQTLRGRLSLSFEDVETQVAFDPPSTQDGTGLRFSLDQDLPNGTISGSLSSNLTSTGRRDIVRVRRTHNLKAGTLGYSVGYATTGGGESSGIFGVNYEQDLRDGQFSLALNQNLENSGDQDRLNTTFTANYRKELNEISSLGASVALRNINALAPNGTDTARFDFDVTYQRAVTRDWNLVGGYRYSKQVADAREDVTSNTVFIGVNRSFNWRH